MGRSIVCAAAMAVLFLVEPHSAFAGDGGEARSADESFHAGRALLKDKRYADACPKFEESQREDPASGTLLALAYCQELSGLLATSWMNYLAAAQLAEREGQTERQTAASERAQAISLRYSKLTVVVPAELLSLPGFRLLRDGVELERASFGIPVATDGGTHAFQATAPGRVPWNSTVTLLAEHDHKTLILPVLDLVPLGQSSSSKPTLPPPLLPDHTSENDTRVALERTSLAFAAATVVGLGVGTAFALSASAKNDQSNENGCDANGCDKHGTDLRNSALSMARVSTWAFVASGACAAASITLFVTASSKGAGPSRSARVQGNLLPGAPSVSIAGSF